MLAAIGGTACGESGGTGPAGQTGGLEVVTSTRGERLDPDGYTVTIANGPPRSISLSATITFSDLPAGPLAVELSGQSSNCTVIGENPRLVSIDKGVVARTVFELVCGELSRAALAFDGTTHATVADAPSFDLTDSWTIEAWVRPTNLAVVEQHLVSKWGSGQVGAFALYIRDRHIQISTRLDPKNTTGASNVPLIEGQWQHVAVTFANGSARIYIDGEIDAGFFGMVVPQITTTPLSLGYASAFACCHFWGELDDVRIWSVARSRQEIRGAMDRQLLGDEPGLSAYWRLDEGSGDTGAGRPGLDVQLGSMPGPDALDPSWSTPGEPQQR